MISFILLSTRTFREIVDFSARAYPSVPTSAIRTSARRDPPGWILIVAKPAGCVMRSIPPLRQRRAVGPFCIREVSLFDAEPSPFRRQRATLNCVSASDPQRGRHLFVPVLRIGGVGFDRGQEEDVMFGADAVSRYFRHLLPPGPFK